MNVDVTDSGRPLEFLSNDGEMASARAPREGFDAHLVKPMDPENLRRVLAGAAP